MPLDDTFEAEPSHPAIKNSQVIAALHGVVCELRETLAPLRSLPALAEAAAHSACSDVRVLQSQVATQEEDLKELKANHLMTTQGMARMELSTAKELAAVTKGLGDINTTMRVSYVLITVALVIVPLVVGTTVWIVQRVPVSPISAGHP